MPIKPGTRIGPYEVTSPLGEGGMGVVYRAHDTKLQRDVALKLLPDHFADDAERLARFQREAQMLASLNHPNIAQIYGLEESGNTRCIVMELVEGQTLQERLRRGPIPIEEALDIGTHISEALEAAHEKGIIHRDLKPANVKITPEGRVKVLDFGLAKWPQDRAIGPESATRMMDVSLTQSGQIMGTVAYMSPEQARGEKLDARTDWFSLGAVLYEMATGRNAFPKAWDWTPPPANGIDPLLYRIILKLLEADRERRYAKAADVAADLKRLQDRLQSSQLKRRRWLILASALGVVALLVIAVIWYRPTQPPAQNQWVQLTNFPDSVSQPALSPDGRMLTFVRGPGTFFGQGQIYVKLLPDGEPVQLTRDNLYKMSPVFSPDGSRIAYTVVEDPKWNTWAVPVLNGQPRPWLANASGLVWLDKQRLLFSEIKNDIHMGIVSSEENRAGAHEIYLPPSERGMAHRSYPSPDGKWVLLAEMDRSLWLPCRVVPLDGSSAGRIVGPLSAGCTFAAWSPDGRWMYFSSSAGGTFHTWRQRFPDGVPERITSGLTEEEGIAMAPDAHSFITAVALRQSSVWIHGPDGDRQISLEGYAFDPKFTPDGKKLCYRILKGTALSDASELHVVELESGHNEPLLPGQAVSGPPGLTYDISADGQQAVAAAKDGEGKRHLWLVALDRQSPPRPIPNAEGDTPLFGAAGEVFFRGFEGNSAFGYRVRQDGTGLQRVINQPIAGPTGISQDGQWLIATVAAEEGFGSRHMAFPVSGGNPLLIIRSFRNHHFQWSANGRLMFISSGSSAVGGAPGHTYVVPLPPGRMLPPIPEGGFPSETDLAKLSGVRVIDGYDVAPGPTPDMYAYSRQTVQRNLYRIPIP